MQRRDFLRVVGGASVLAALPMGWAKSGKETGVTLEKLAQPPFNTTLMGVLNGALDYHKIETSAPMVFGLSGHAFLINIHKQLSPSGPYCWNSDAMHPLIKNLGLDMVGLGLPDSKNTPEERSAIDKKLRDALDASIPCSLLKWENQLISGYDDTAFTVLQPWGSKVDVTPGRLTFGTWKELIKDFPPFFHLLKAAKPANARQAILDSLDYAVDLHANPARHAWKDYGIGPDAYDLWIKAAPQFGSTHGNWWNGQVYSECRRMASKYFAEIQQHFESVAKPAGELATLYADIADNLDEASDKKLPAAEKVTLLTETKDLEAATIKKVAAFTTAFRAARS